VLHAGGKFGDGGYKVSGGLHGVGSSVVNGLSKKLIVTVYRDGKMFQQEYAKGVPLADLKAIGKTDRTGTEITFYADDTIFESIIFNYETILDRLRHAAYLTKGLHTSVWKTKPPGDAMAFTLRAAFRATSSTSTSARKPCR
jgi:DNA gyrase subunit B